MPTSPKRQVLIYEWVTGGGLVDSSGSLPESLVREGIAMVHAAVDDAASASLEPVLLRDLRLPQVHAAQGRTIEVGSRAEHDSALQEAALQADAVLVIAPETDGTLLRTVRRLESINAPLVSPGSEFVEVAADKHRAAQALQAAGVPTPEGVVVESGAALPIDFEYPAVIKPIDGAGSQDLQLVASATDRPAPYAWPRRLERYARGAAVSVSLIGVRGDGDPVAMPACRQHLSVDGRFTYQGGSTPLPDGLARRAADLATAAVRALPPLVGYVGVDLVIGDEPDGGADWVIEINPRLTTSFVGLRRAARRSLLRAMVDAAAGEPPTLDFDSRALGFDADGAVYWA